MARRSPLVNQKYDTGCTWRMFRIFNFREGHSDKRLVSNRRHLSAHANAAGNGNSRSSSDVPSTVDEKYLQSGVSSRRRRYYSCKSINYVERDQEADWRNAGTKMLVDQILVNKNYQGKEGRGCHPNQYLDALQILYSNKELFMKLLQDPNSLLVKQIHDLERSQVKEPYQARQKRMARLNKPQKSNTTECVKPFESSDMCDLRPSCKPQSSKRIVVLKPDTVNVNNVAPDSFSSNAQNIRPSLFPFARIKRKLRHVMKVRRHEKQWMTADGMPCEFSCSSQGLEDGKKVKELEVAEQNSPINAHKNTEKRLNLYLDLKKRDNIIKLKDSELCRGQEAVSFCESCSKDTYSVNTLDDKLQFFEDISIRNSLPGDNLQQHYDIPRGGRYKDSPTQNIDINNTTGGSGSFLDLYPEIQTLSFSQDVASSSPSSSCQRTEETVNMRNIVEHHNTESAVEQFMEDDVTTNSPISIFQPDESPIQIMHDNKFEENQFADLIRSSSYPMNNLTSSKNILDYVREILLAFNLKWDELSTKGSFDQLLDPSTFDELKELTGQLSSSTILLDCVIEAFMEVYQNNGFSFHVSSKNPNVPAYVIKKILVKEIIELVNLHFNPHQPPLTLEQLVEKDFARRGSWLNIHVCTEDIAVELEEDVLDKLVMEIASETYR